MHNDWNDWSGLNISTLATASASVHVCRTIDDVLMSEARLYDDRQIDRSRSSAWYRLSLVYAPICHDAVVKKRVTDYCSTTMRARLIEYMILSLYLCSSFAWKDKIKSSISKIKVEIFQNFYLFIRFIRADRQRTDTLTFLQSDHWKINLAQEMIIYGFVKIWIIRQTTRRWHDLYLAIRW